MPTQQSAQDVLDRHYLEIRCGLLDLAASLDRVSRQNDASRVARDPRMELIQQGIRILSQGGSSRAEQIQLLFSDEYDPSWNQK